MVEKYKQDNGLTVLLEPVDSVVSVSVGLWLKTGSRHERSDQYGYAHFTEHMLFKGTEKYSAIDLARLVDRVGGQHNAATNREYTCYYINVVSDHLDLAIEILSEMYYNSLLDPEELEKEKNVIIEEIRMYEDTPDEFIHDLFMEKMLSGHPLSHSILGSIDGISSTTSEKLNSFYRDHYRNDNAIFVIAGKFDKDNAKNLVSRHFHRKNDPLSPGENDKFPAPERIEQAHVNRDLEQVHFCLGTEGIRRDDENRWALYAMSTILGGSMSSRLFQKVREKEGLCYSIYSFHSSYIDNGIFGIYCATSPDKFGRAVEIIVDECRDMLINGVTEKELDDAKTFMKGNLALSYESTEVRMGQLAKNEMTYGQYFSFDDIVSNINDITMDNYRQMVSSLFKDKRFSSVSVGKVSDSEIDKLDLKI